MVSELSIVLAKIIAISYLTIGLAAFLHKNYYQKLLDDMLKSPGIMFVMGLFSLIIGFILVTYHNFWVSDWTVLITVIGWLALFKGFFIIVFPKHIGQLSKRIFKMFSPRVVPYFCFLFGLIFAYFGFMA